MSDELDHISPREGERARSRDRKRQPPKVIAVNPGLKQLALHLADKRRAKKKPSR